MGSLLLEMSVSITIMPVLWYHWSLSPAGLRIRYMLPVSYISKPNFLNRGLAYRELI